MSASSDLETSNEAEPLTASDVVAKRLLELRVELDPEIHYRLETIFPKVTGWGSNALIKEREKSLHLIEPTLKRLLYEKEEVQYVAIGRSHLLVSTPVRLIVMQKKGQGEPAEPYWSFFYSEVQDAQVSHWLETLTLKLRDGQTFKTIGITADDGKPILHAYKLGAAEFRRLGLSPNVSQSRENLCSECFNLVPKGEFQCAHCRCKFWTPSDVAQSYLVRPFWTLRQMQRSGLVVFDLMEELGAWGLAIAFVSVGMIGMGIQVVGGHVVKKLMGAGAFYFQTSQGLYRRLDTDEFS